MEDYLRCIFTKILEDGFTEKYQTLRTYRGCLARRNAARDKLEAALSPAQMELFDQYETERNVVDSMELEAFFEEAVAVGKQMAR